MLYLVPIFIQMDCVLIFNCIFSASTNFTISIFSNSIKSILSASFERYYYLFFVNSFYFFSKFFSDLPHKWYHLKLNIKWRNLIWVWCNLFSSMCARARRSVSLSKSFFRVAIDILWTWLDSYNLFIVHLLHAPWNDINKIWNIENIGR